MKSILFILYTVNVKVISEIGYFRIFNEDISPKGKEKPLFGLEGKENYYTYFNTQTYKAWLLKKKSGSYFYN